jgi:hypothetical protein
MALAIAMVKTQLAVWAGVAPKAVAAERTKAMVDPKPTNAATSAAEIIEMRIKPARLNWREYRWRIWRMQEEGSGGAFWEEVKRAA